MDTLLDHLRNGKTKLKEIEISTKENSELSASCAASQYGQRFNNEGYVITCWQRRLTITPKNVIVMKQHIDITMSKAKNSIKQQNNNKCMTDIWKEIEIYLSRQDESNENELECIEDSEHIVETNVSHQSSSANLVKSQH
eukprot:261444_1